MDVLTEVAKDFDAAFILNQRLSVLRKDPVSEQDVKQVTQEIAAFANFELFEPPEEPEERGKPKGIKSGKKKYPKARIVGKVYLRHRVW